MSFLVGASLRVAGETISEVRSVRQETGIVNSTNLVAGLLAGNPYVG